MLLDILARMMHAIIKYILKGIGELLDCCQLSDEVVVVPLCDLVF